MEALSLINTSGCGGPHANLSHRCAREIFINMLNRASLPYKVAKQKAALIAMTIYAVIGFSMFPFNFSFDEDMLLN